MAQLRTKIFHFPFSIFRSRNGQSLAEILVAIAVALILIGSSVLLIGVALRGSTETRYQQAATLLAQELMDKVTSYAEHRWHCPSGVGNCKKEDGSANANYGLYNLTKGPDNPANHYYLNTSIQPFEWASGDEPVITLDNISYTRYFFIQNICRNGNDISGITSGNGGTIICLGGGVEDPTTQKITVKTTWQEQGITQEVKIEKYLTRHTGNRVFHQTDWSGGPKNSGGNPVVVSDPDSYFFTHTNIDYSTPGEIKIE